MVLLIVKFSVIYIPNNFQTFLEKKKGSIFLEFLPNKCSFLPTLLQQNHICFIKIILFFFYIL
jgi:hypothetical protein